ncbi:MAG TPA: hypothetical protein DIT09_06630 [Glutamicibacter sp.]|nr:hypothetical protein [Glutamicibacter sp.]
MGKPGLIAASSWMALDSVAAETGIAEVTSSNPDNARPAMAKRFFVNAPFVQGDDGLALVVRPMHRIIHVFD